MKRWPLVVVVLYALALLLLTAPTLLLAFSASAKSPGFSMDSVWRTYGFGIYWLWLGVLVAGQAALLLLPMSARARRPTARRPLRSTVVVSAFFLANLLGAGLFSIACAVLGDHALDVFKVLDAGPGNGARSTVQQIGSVVFVLLLFWVFWAAVFRRFARADDPDALLKRSVHWLMRGSILELLVAVPSHVIARRRNDCCASVGTFWGIATGLSLMLLCFGPGVSFLFAERFKRLRPKRDASAVRM